MSLRQIAKQLGISHTLLVLWRQGKRNLSPELQAKYHTLVTSGYNSTDHNRSTPSPPPGPVAQLGQSIGLLIRVSRVRIPAGPLLIKSCID